MNKKTRIYLAVPPEIENSLPQSDVPRNAPQAERTAFIVETIEQYLAGYNNGRFVLINGATCWDTGIAIYFFSPSKADTKGATTEYMEMKAKRRKLLTIQVPVTAKNRGRRKVGTLIQFACPAHLFDMLPTDTRDRNNLIRFFLSSRTKNA